MIDETQAMLPAWIVVPPAMMLVIAVGAHLLAMRSSDMPASRRRIRIANGLLMMVVVPLTAYAFCAVSPKDARFFVLTWCAVVGLVSLVVAMAVADLLNNLWISYRNTRAVRTQIKALQHALLEHARNHAKAQQPSSPEGHPSN